MENIDKDIVEKYYKFICKECETEIYFASENEADDFRHIKALALKLYIIALDKPKVLADCCKDNLHSSGIQAVNLLSAIAHAIDDNISSIAKLENVKKITTDYADIFNA